MVVTAYQHETKHPQIHRGVTRMRQPGQRVRGAQPDKTDDGRPGHEHGEGHFEAVPPTVAPDAHPDDHWPGHEQRHPDPLKRDRNEAFEGHIDQHADIHGEHHLAEVEDETSDAQGIGSETQFRGSGHRFDGERVRHSYESHTLVSLRHLARRPRSGLRIWPSIQR